MRFALGDQSDAHVGPRLSEHFLVLFTRVVAASVDRARLGVPFVVARRSTAVAKEADADAATFDDHHRGHDPPCVRPESPAPTGRRAGECGRDGVGWREFDARFGSHIAALAQSPSPSQPGGVATPARAGLTSCKDASTLPGSRGGTEEPGMTCGGRNDALTLRGHCACLVCLSATSSLRTLPPTPPSSGPASWSAGSDGGRSEFHTERRWRAVSALAGSGVLGRDVATLRSSLLSRTGTNKHSPLVATPPKYLILHAPRVARTPALLIRSRPVGGDIRDVSRTYASGCLSRAHEKSPISPPKDTEKTQSHRARKFPLARRAWGCARGDASRPGTSPPPRMGTCPRVE